MLLAHQHYGSDRGFASNEFYKVVEQVSGLSLNDWFAEVADTASDLDYSEALAWFGLRFKLNPLPQPPRPRHGLG